MLPLLLPVPGGSKEIFEVLRLWSESNARRTENFHPNIPSTWIYSGEEAPSPEWHLPGPRESPAPSRSTHQRGNNRATRTNQMRTMLPPRIAAILSRQA